MDSPFDILGIDPDADDDEIKQAYRRRAKETHPDHGGSTEAFQAVRDAYEAISDGSITEREATGRASRSSGSARSGDVSGRGAGSRDGPGPEWGPGDDRSAGTASETRSDTGDDGSASRDDPEEAAEDPRKEWSQVEYLNYEILDDYGWSLDDEDLFETAADEGLDDEDYGTFWVEPRESILEAAERAGYAWPFACRGGACANCAIVVRDGEMTTRVDHVLPPDLVDQGFQLSCNGMPTSDEMQILFNVKHVPELEELLLPPTPFKQAYSDD